jgi:hypothetical protein
MPGSEMTTPKVTDTLNRLGSCIELITMDPHYRDITVGLYQKDGVLTLWSFSRRDGVEGRLRQVRDQLVALGGLSPLPRSNTRVNFPCGYMHQRPVKFLMMQAVEKPPDHRPPDGDISVKDIKSGMMLYADGSEVDGRWVYRIRGDGAAKNPAARIRSAARGFVRYGEMEQTGDADVSFICGHRHDALMKVIFPYARNLSGTEDKLEADALRGQLTTGTLGFTPQ